jgi:ATPase subunit of ABC transporter with duplicated ATPase domains
VHFSQSAIFIVVYLIFIIVYPNSSNNSDVTGAITLGNSSRTSLPDFTVQHLSFCFAAPVFCDVEWTINEGESWAVIGTGSKQKTALLQVRHADIAKRLH